MTPREQEPWRAGSAERTMVEAAALAVETGDEAIDEEEELK